MVCEVQFKHRIQTYNYLYPQCKLCDNSSSLAIDVCLKPPAFVPLQTRYSLSLTYIVTLWFFYSRFRSSNPDVSHASLPGAAHHGILTYEHVQQGVLHHGAQHGHDNSGRPFNSRRALQD